MAQLSITIPDAVLPRVVDAFAETFNYQQNQLNGETRAQFSRRQLIKFAADVVEAYESKSAVENFRVGSETARQQAIQNTRNEVQIT